MQGLFATRHSAAYYLATWTLLGVFVAALLVAVGRAAWINALLLALPLTLVFGFLSGYSAYYLCRANPLGDAPPMRVFAALGVAALVSGLAWMLMAQGLDSLLLMAGREWAGVSMDVPLALLLTGLGALFYSLTAVVHYLRMESTRAADAERVGLESRLAAQIAELRLLRTQIEPHFLFNSLNSISALTSVNPAGAREMTLRLADFFRQGLGLAAQDRISLRAELELSRNFLAIEQVRFGERLQPAEDIDAAALDCLVPPMVIQPLVENAVKHGISQMTDAGRVHIAARCEGEVLHIVVENSADDDAGAQRKGTGLGLVNVRQRLAAAFGDAGRCEIRRLPGGFRVHLILPAVRHASGA